MTGLANYSKWDNLELSDDDTDTLPRSIDKDSYIKYTKSKRVQRNNEEEKERDALRAKVEKAEKELRQLGTVGRTHVKGQKIQQQLEEDKKTLDKLERRMDRRLDTDKLCKEGYSKSVISNAVPGYENLAPKRTENVDVDVYGAFVEKHEALLEEYLDLRVYSFSRSTDFILKHPEVLLSSDAETYCMFHCLELEMNGKHDEMKSAARQGQIITQSLELSKMLSNGNPGAGAGPGDTVVLNKRATEGMLQKLAEDEALQESFGKSVAQFIERIQARAITKKAELDEEAAAKAKTKIKKETAPSSTAPAADGKKTEEKNEEQLGPGGLDAQEVFDTLPEVLQEAFLAKDMQQLEAAFQSLPSSDAEYQMKRCIAGGLWVMPGTGFDRDDGRSTDEED